VKARLIAVEAEWKSTRDELRQVQQRVLALEEAIGTTSTTPSVWSQIDDLVQGTSRCRRCPFQADSSAAVFLLVAIAAGLGEAEACHAWNEYGSRENHPAQVSLDLTRCTVAALRDAGLQDFLARPALQPGDGPPPPPKNPSALSAYQRPPVIHSLTEYHFFVSPNGYLDLSHLSPPSSATLFRAPSLLNKAAGAPPSAPPPPSVPALRYYGERSSRLGRAMLAAIAAEPVLTGVFSLERALRLDLETLQRPRSDLAHRRIKDRVTAGSILLGAIIRHSRTEDHAEVLQAAGALLSNGARFQGDAGRKVVPLVAADGR
jgi:hypothetical protein